MFFSTLFALFGLGALCWILFNLAVYALPFAIGLTSGIYLYETGQGVFLSIMAGLFIGGLVAALGEFAFDRIRWSPKPLASCSTNPRMNAPAYSPPRCPSSASTVTRSSLP